MCWQYQNMIRQSLEFRKAIEKLPSEFNRLPGKKIWSANIAYKKRISAENSSWFGATASICHHISDMFRCMPGRIKHPNVHVFDLKFISFLNGPMWKCTLTCFGDDDFCTCPRGQIHVTRNEVGVKMRFENMGNAHSHGFGHGYVLFDISPRVNDSTCFFSPEKVREMCKTRNKKGLNKHILIPPFFNLNIESYKQ